MPQFILSHGTKHAARFYATLDGFTQGYIEAMFFTDTSDSDDGDLADAATAGLAPETLANIIGDCEAFQAAHAALLERSYQLGLPQGCYDETRAGRDFWFTRNGHGVGFLDRGLGDVGTELSDASKTFRSLDLYRGDDGLIYLA